MTPRIPQQNTVYTVKNGLYIAKFVSCAICNEAVQKASYSYIHNIITDYAVSLSFIVNQMFLDGILITIVSYYDTNVMLLAIFQLNAVDDSSVPYKIAISSRG
jgi:hypothetical protein